MKSQMRKPILAIGITVALVIFSGWVFSRTANATLIGHLRQTISVTFAGTAPMGFGNSDPVTNPEAALSAMPQDTGDPQVGRGNDPLLRIIRSEQAVTGGGVTVRLQQVAFYAAVATATACIQLPDNADWLPVASLTFGGQRVMATGWRLHDSKNPTTYTASSRCYDFDFPLLSGNGNAAESGSATDVNHVDFSVEKLTTSLPEAPTAEDCEKGRQKLQDAQLGIVVVCKPAGNGFVSLEVLRKPESMTYGEAQKAVVEALSKSVTGPWTVSVREP